MALCPRVTTYPPLGKVTTVLREACEEIQFFAVVEWFRDGTRPCQFELLYSTAADGSHPSSWPSTPFTSTDETASVVRHANDRAFQATFELRIDFSSLFSGATRQITFAIQYRASLYDTWKTVRNAVDIDTGEIIIVSNTAQNINFDQLFHFESGWSAKSFPAQNGVPTWQITSSETLPSSTEDGHVLQKTILGKAIGASRFMAITRIEPYWFGCEHAKSHFHLSNDGIMLSFLNNSGQTVTMLAFNEADVYTVFKSDSTGSVFVCCRNDSMQDVHPQILAAVSSDSQKSIAAVMNAARAQATQNPKLKSLVEDATKSIGALKPASFDTSFFDNAGFCTWNGLGQDLTAQKILDALEKMKQNGVLLNTLLIDDNWQTVRSVDPDGESLGSRAWTTRGWVRFEANESFPGGLKMFISEIKSRFPHIQYVGVWHALLGYWAGIAPNSDFEKDYRVRSTRMKLGGYMKPSTILTIDPADIHRFFDDFYAFLADSGVDFVKTDVQYTLGQFDDPSDRAEYPSAYQSAWTSAHLKHFQGRVISCMSMIPQISLHSFLQQDTPKILLRNSDDFFPEIPESHPFHIFVNAHNALITQHLNCVPDWDMFQTSRFETQNNSMLTLTDHDYSSYHAAARAISGGPVLITDEPGRHDTKLIDEMTALSPAGKRIAIRPELATTDEYWNAYAEGHMLKIGASTATGARIIGVFNTADGQKDELIPLNQITGAAGHGAPEHQRWAVRSHSTGQILLPGQMGVSNLLKVKLQFRQWDVLSAFPVYEFGKNEMVVLGLLDKISGAAAVTECQVKENRIVLKLKALGKLAVMLRGEVSVESVVVNQETVDLKYTTATDSGGGRIVTVVDLESYWTDQKLWREIETFSVNFHLNY